MAYPATHRRVATKVTAVVLALTIVAAGGCSSGNEPTEAGYCKLVDEHLTDLASPAVPDEAAIATIIKLYQRVVDASPLGIQPEWKTLLASLELAAAVDPNDPTSVQAAADAARESQVAANSVITYTQEHCSLALGLPGNTAAPTTSSIPGS
jgi:hypothetical protein